MSEEAVYKINISANKDAAATFKGMTKAINVDPNKFPLIGKKVGDTFNGAIIGLPGYELKITGGSDRAGIPMRKDVHGPGKKRVLLSAPPCFHPDRSGKKRRKMVRGNEISDDIVQVNAIVVKFGKEKLFSPKEEKPKEE